MKRLVPPYFWSHYEINLNTAQQFVGPFESSGGWGLVLVERGVCEGVVVNDLGHIELFIKLAEQNAVFGLEIFLAFG